MRKRHLVTGVVIAVLVAGCSGPADEAISETQSSSAPSDNAAGEDATSEDVAGATPSSSAEPDESADSDDPESSDDYATQMAESLAEAESLIEDTPASPSNDHGWRTVETAYTELAQTWETDITAPSQSASEHDQLVAQARTVAKAAKTVADSPKKGRFGTDLPVTTAREALSAAIADL